MTSLVHLVVRSSSQSVGEEKYRFLRTGDTGLRYSFPRGAKRPFLQAVVLGARAVRIPASVRAEDALKQKACAMTGMCSEFCEPHSLWDGGIIS